MSTGARLRRARLDAGITIDRVFEITKIPIWILHSIERDDVSTLPGGVFIRGYLTSFANAIGVDAHEILTSHFGQPPAPAVAAAPEVRRPGYTGTPLWQVAALIALVVATAIVWRDAWKRADVEANVPSPIQLAPQSLAPPAAPLTSTALSASARDAAAPLMSAAMTTVVSETPTNRDDVVASQVSTPTSAIDPLVVASEPDEPTEPPALDPSVPTAPAELTEPSEFDR